jgi:transcriptional regulator with XRE-family HTH domain
MKRLPSVGTSRSFATNAVFPEDNLAEGANLDRTYLSGIERGVRNPGIKVVIKLARVLVSPTNS